ncbi:LamG-like jellyroll fold domain-containing protein [Kutzneria sp. 744]|uniref:LamG-like jellyroll fold domain-containing protein n=1 Tax=Kutzneria sp. (strain 744) TaxID=345341 RepID=UPI0012F7FA48|nr:LamG-like jellyroll fold domain-containing protein [Kutzneria sp. 744]
MVILTLGLSTESASAAELALPAINLPSPMDVLSWLASPSWGNLPKQQGGTADGKSHQVPASATRAGRGIGKAPGKGVGELPPEHPPSHPTIVGASTKPAARAVAGFNAQTSHRNAAKSSATMSWFSNADGTVTKKYTQEPSNYRDGHGDWQPIDTMVALGGDKRWHEKANSLGVDFAPQANDATLASFAVDAKHGISYGLQGAVPVTPKVSGQHVTYPGILANTDLTVTPTPTGLKESVVLRTSSAGSSWTFPLHLNGLTPKLAKDGSVSLVDSAGKEMQRIPRAYAFDSKVDPASGDPATTYQIKYELVDAHGTPALKISLDPKWLADPHRVFPVTVDPTFTLTPNTTYVESDSPGDHSMEQTIKIGSYDGSVAARSLLSFPSDIDGSGIKIDAATLNLFDTWASSCTPEDFGVNEPNDWWDPKSVSWPGPGIGTSMDGQFKPPNVPNACTNTKANREVGDWVSVPLSPEFAQTWANGGDDLGLLVAAIENDSLHWKQFDSANMYGFQPTLWLTTEGDVPPQIDSMWPANGQTMQTLTPWLFAAGHDVDTSADSLQYQFQIWQDANTKVADSGPIDDDYWTVPAGKLTYGQSYFWTVQTLDGTYSSNVLAWNQINIQVPQPAITSSLSQNSSAQGFDPSIQNYTTSATDVTVPTPGPSLSVVRDYNSRDPRRTGGFGVGWSGLFDTKATERTDPYDHSHVNSVNVTYPDGSEVGYGKNSDGTYSPSPGRFATFKSITNGYSLTDKNDTTYTFTQNLGAGTYGVSSISDANGRTETFTWVNNQITAVTSAVSGRSLHVTWNTPAGATSPHVAAVATDPVTSGQSASALTWTYSYQGDQLSSVCPPGASTACTRYGYDSGSQYQNQVLDQGPHSFWPLAETSGTTANSGVLINEGADNGTYANVNLGQPGPLPGSSATSAGFNGTSSYVQLSKDMTAGSFQTLSLWFKTTAVNGVLYSSSSLPITNNTTTGFYTPGLYVGSDGKLLGQFWTGDATNPLKTANPVNDGNWHHVLISSLSAAQAMYLDGGFVGQAAGALAVPLQRFNYIGAGFLGGAWPDEANQGKDNNTGYASYFNGSIADVAFYDTALDYHQIIDQYQAAKYPASLLSQITQPSGAVSAKISYDPVSAAVRQVTDANNGVWQVAAPVVHGTGQFLRQTIIGDNPTAYYRLMETPGSTKARSEVTYQAGTYSSGVTLGVDDAYQDGGTAAQFDGKGSSVELPASTITSATDGLSIELWFRTTKRNEILVGDTTTPGQNCAVGQACLPVLWVGSDGKLYGSLPASGQPQLSSANTVDNGFWHYVMLTGSATSQTLYEDLNTPVTAASGALATGGNTHLLLGSGTAGAGWHGLTDMAVLPTDGAMGDVAFYHKAFTKDDVKRHTDAISNSKGIRPDVNVYVTDPGGKYIYYRFDPVYGNRKIATTDNLTGAFTTVTYNYDTSGFLNKVTDANGIAATTGHDVRGNTVSQTTCQDQAANKCSTAYYTYYPDDTTKQLTTTDARNDVLLTVRDGRSSSATDPTYLTTYGYDAKGNKTTVTTPPVPGFPNGRTTTITYSDGTSAYPAADGGSVPAGMPVKTVSPGGASNSVSYLHDGDVASTTNADGLVTKFGYDGIGRAASQTVVSDSYPSGLTTTYGYDAHNHVTTQTDPTATNRVTGARHTAVTTSLYDPDGNLTSQTVADSTGGDASRTVGSTYNSLDQKTSTTDANGKTTKYGYDVYGNKTSQIDPAGTETDWTYDAAGHQLTQSIQYNGSPLNPQPVKTLTEASRAYDPGGRLASVTDSMGITTSYTYLDNNLTATVTKADVNGQNKFQVESDSYDNAGNLTSKTTNNGATMVTSTVDAADRTTTTTVDPTGVDRTTTLSYTPDDKPATTTQTDSAGFDRTVNASYDPMGNVVSESLYGDSKGHPVGWWPLNQTAGATVPDASGSGNTGSATNVTWTDGAAKFDGSASKITTNGPAVNTTSGYSVSAWVSLDKLDNYYTAVAQGGGNAASFYLQYSPAFHNWAFVSPSSDSGSASAYPAAHDSQAPNKGTWTHLVGIFDDRTNTMSLYVDNRLAGTAPNSTPWTGNGPLTIGAAQTSGGAASNWLPGEVSDVQVYSRALTASDVQTLFTAGRDKGTVASTPSVNVSRALDQRGLPKTQTDANGKVTSYSYDEAGHLSVTTAPTVSTEVNGGSPTQAHPVASAGYNTFGEATEQQDANGNVDTTVYDADGQPVSITQPNYTPPGASAPITAVTVNSYDAAGNLADVTDPLNHKVSYLYDQLGDRVRATQPNGAKTESVYDTNGQLLQQTDPTGAQTQATYDVLGRQLTSTVLERYPSAVTATTTNSYTASAINPNGAFLASTTSPSGATITYGYDNVGEKTSVKDGAGNVNSFGYDFVGRQQSTTMADKSKGTTTFDAAGNPIGADLFDANGTKLASVTAGYDGDGNKLTDTDARGTTVRRSYDALGRLAQATQPVSATSSITTSFGYDAAGNRTRVTDGRGNSWISAYNTWNRQESTLEPATARYTTDADRRSTTGYDADGRPTRTTEPGGVTIAAGYDVNGNMVTRTGTGGDAPTANITIGYDLDGRVTSAKTDAIGTGAAATNETFGYNDRGSLLTATGSAGSSSFGYTVDGLTASRSDAAGSTLYSYDTADRLATVTDAATGTKVGYSYNTLNQVSQITYGSNGNVRTFGYDGQHRLASDTLATASKTTIASIGYGYDPNGNLTSKNTNGFGNAAANTYTYDLANRLSAWTVGGTSTNYGYDASGNRTQAGANVYTYDARDELTSDGTTNYSYSARGTLSQQGTTAVTFDAFGQMATHGNQKYTYDGLGRALSSGTDTFSYAGDNTTPSSDGHNVYTYDPSGKVIGIGSGTPGTGLLAFIDLHNDVVGEFSAAATTLSGSTTYDPLGNAQPGANLTGKLGYQSGWTDPATGKVDMAARWYNPKAGQFASKDTAPPDPAVNPNSANSFGYVDGDPLTRTDPTGHSWWDDLSSAVSDAWDTVTSAASDAWGWVDDNIIQPCVHAWDDLVDTVEDDWDQTWNWIDDTAYGVVNDVGQAWDDASDFVSTAYDDVQTKVVPWVQNHESTIASFATGAATFVGCTALTGGVGAIGCAALAGEAAGAVAYSMDCGKSQDGCTGDGILTAMGLGVLGGALGGALAGPLGGQLVSDALGGILPKIAINALVGAGAGAGSGAVVATTEYGLSCSSSKDGCSVEGALDAAGGGALTGALFGALGGVIAGGGGDEPGATPEGEIPAVGESVPAAETAPAQQAAPGAEAAPAAGGPSEESAAPPEEDEPESCPFPPPTPHSFTGQTKVLMADGSTKPISQVKVGDQIADAVPGDSSQQTHTVQDVITTTTDKDFVDVMIAPSKVGAALAGMALAAAATLTTTYHHPFYDVTQAAFVEAIDLKAGDQVQTSDGDTATVTGVRAYHQQATTYDLTINGLHTYFVLAGDTPVLVHNINTPLAGVCGPKGEDVFGIPPGSKNGPGAFQGITPSLLRDYNIGANARANTTAPMCSYCRVSSAQALDHVWPRIGGGDLTDDNLTPACRRCNSSKRDRVAAKTPPSNYVGLWPPPWWPQWMVQGWQQTYGLTPYTVP